MIEQYLRIIKALNDHDVKYLIVGGYAVNFHGYNRSTTDLDIWLDSTKENMVRLEKAFVLLGYDPEMCRKAVSAFVSDHAIKIPLEKTKIDMLDSSILKEDFDKCSANSVSKAVKGTALRFIGLDDLLAIKKKSNRLKDLLDFKNLQTLKEGKVPYDGSADDVFSLR